MLQSARLFLFTALVLGATLGGGVNRAVAGQEAEPSPGLVGQAIHSDMYAAQAALLSGDTQAAATAVASATEAEAQLAPLLQSDPTIASDLERQLAEARLAVAHDDPIQLALVHGQVWSTLVRGAFAETLAAAASGDADEAARWLLLRDFRLTTRFDRPSGDATRATKALRDGASDAAQASAVVKTDLLDTYQARLESSLNALTAASPGSFAPSDAEAIGLAVGYWPVLAPALEEQLGVDARVNADAAFAALLSSAKHGDAAAFAVARDEAIAVVQSFRAAPLDAAEQARRTGQLLRYLSLVPMEYSRGVKDGQVLVALEVQEARAFLDGAQVAFADLRLPLRAMDPAETAAIEAALTSLDASVSGAITGASIADPSAVSADAEAASQRLTALVPPAWLEASADSDFDIVASILDQMVAAAAAGQYRQAESSRLEAYAIFETGPEKRLLAFTPSEAQRVERLFWEGEGQTLGLQQLLARQASVAEVGATRGALDDALNNAQASLNAGTAPAVVIFNAATIVFREGLEAVLILASLLASMVGANRVYKRPLAIGAFAAFGATVLLFALAGAALLSFGRYSEQIEAVVSVIAIGVLLLVMNWFFHKVYWTRWIAARHEHRRRLLIGGVAGPALGFIVLGFSSVFREGAETVLFLQALVLDAGTAVVVQGTLLGLAATLVVGALTLIMQTKLPHKKMLIVTGLMIAAVLVTMVGSTVHTLQLVGWAPISPIPDAEDLPFWLGVWFGIYGTWQGVAAQIAALVLVIGSYLLAERQHEQSRRSRGSNAARRVLHQGESVPA